MTTVPRTEQRPRSAPDPAWDGAFIGAEPQWVRLRRPRALRGEVALIRRACAGGWEVETRTDRGVPVHLVVPERDLVRVAAEADDLPPSATWR